MFTLGINKYRKIDIRALVAAVLLLVLITQTAVCKEQAWQRYQSTYFIANSNASHKKTLTILKELELFRAAAVQVVNLHLPESAEKTAVLILKTKKEFRSLGYGRNVAAFAMYHNGQFLIVMPAAGDLDWAKSVVRHEYSHVLLGYSKIRFPQWYNEGLAELLSAVDFRDRDTTFTVGETPGRIKGTSGNSFDWNTLIADGFDRSMNIKNVSSAYLQSWLLTHYVMLGEDFSNTPKLHEYLRLTNAGQPSLLAFEQAFGMDGNELWVRKLQSYSKRLFYVVYDFRPGALHTDFERSSSDVAEVESLLDQIRARAIAYE